LLVEQSELFGVTIIVEEQLEISDRFARRNLERDSRFTGVDPAALVSGAPILNDGLAHIDCIVINIFCRAIIEAFHQRYTSNTSSKGRGGFWLITIG